MIQQTIDELRELKNALEENHFGNPSDIYTLNKAIIACEQLRKARKKAKRWKRKYLEMRSLVEKSAEVLEWSDKNGLHLSYPAWKIANRLGKALEPYLLERLKGGEE